MQAKKFVYNVGGRPEWEKEIKDYSDSVLKAVGRDDSIVSYKEAEPFTNLFLERKALPKEERK